MGGLPTPAGPGGLAGGMSPTPSPGGTALAWNSCGYALGRPGALGPCGFFWPRAPFFILHPCLPGTNGPLPKGLARGGPRARARMSERHEVLAVPAGAARPLSEDQDGSPGFTTGCAPPGRSFARPGASPTGKAPEGRAGIPPGRAGPGQPMLRGPGWPALCPTARAAKSLQAPQRRGCWRTWSKLPSRSTVHPSGWGRRGRRGNLWAEEEAVPVREDAWIGLLGPCRDSRARQGPACPTGAVPADGMSRDAPMAVGA